MLQYRNNTNNFSVAQSQNTTIGIPSNETHNATESIITISEDTKNIIVVESLVCLVVILLTWFAILVICVRRKRRVGYKDVMRMRNDDVELCTKDDAIVTLIAVEEHGEALSDFYRQNVDVAEGILRKF